MREIKAKVKIGGTKKTVEVEALLDTGSTMGLVPKEMADEIGLAVLEPLGFDAKLSDGRTIKVNPAVAFAEIDGCKSPILIGVSEKASLPISLGMIQMEEMGITIDAQKGYVVSCKPLRA